jgi:hypothetical protein
LAGILVAAKPARAGSVQSEVEQEAYRFRDLVSAQWLLAETDPSRGEELAQLSFKVAQWALGSKAAVSLAQMAARVAAADATTR